jgi:acetyl esterase/lipase
MVELGERNLLFVGILIGSFVSVGLSAFTSPPEDAAQSVLLEDVFSTRPSPTVPSSSTPTPPAPSPAISVTALVCALFVFTFGLYPAAFRSLGKALSSVDFFIYYFIRFVRFWTCYPAVPMAKLYYWLSYASDGLPVLQDVVFERNYRYGELEDECLDIVRPKDASTIKGHVLYVHGGGFVCVNREVMLQSITPLVRSGLAVYCVDYPFAPEHKHPIPVVSILKSLAWIKRHTGVAEVDVIGDSAGGSLAAMAAAVACNRSQASRILPNSQFDASFDLPHIGSLSLLYTICDETSWKAVKHLGLFSSIQNIVIAYCLNLYRPTLGGASPAHITIVDILENVEIKELKFPKTLLISASKDPLSFSHLRFNEVLGRQGVESRMLQFPAHHAFHGIPCAWTQGGWRLNAYPANKAILEWIDGESNVGRLSLPPLPLAKLKREDDYRLIAVVAISFALPIYVITRIVYVHNVLSILLPS